VIVETEGRRNMHNRINKYLGSVVVAQCPWKRGAACEKSCHQPNSGLHFSLLHHQSCKTPPWLVAFMP
jgi:hypothetical protein